MSMEYKIECSKIVLQGLLIQRKGDMFVWSASDYARRAWEIADAMDGERLERGYKTTAEIYNEIVDGKKE